jgi:hypothetical protein
MDSLVYVRRGPLAMTPDEGIVYFERGEGEPERLGFVFDPDAEPWGHSAAWAELLEWWEDSVGHEAEAERAFRRGIDLSRLA